MNDLWVTFNIKEDLLPRVQEGSVLKAYVPGLDKSIKLTVYYLAVEAEYATWALHVPVANSMYAPSKYEPGQKAKSKGLRPGMTVTVNWDELNKSLSIMKKAFRTFWAVLIRELQLFPRTAPFPGSQSGCLSFLLCCSSSCFSRGVPRDLPVAIYDQDHTPLSRQLIRMIDATPSAMVAYEVTNLAEGERLLKREKSTPSFTFRTTWRKRLQQYETNVVAYINASISPKTDC